MINQELIQRLEYSYSGQQKAVSLPLPLIESLQIISDFFSNNSNHKLCLVFPTKEFAAQWLSIPTVLFLIESDFAQFKNEIAESLEKYKRGDWIILNNEAVVEWVGRSVNGFIFKHKEYNRVDEITIDIKKIFKIQPAPPSRRVLSGYKRVIEAIGKINENPIDKILGIQTEGNKLYQKNSICLISKHISFENSISEIAINNFLVDEYFKQGKIDDIGEADMKSPLLISNNLTNLALYVTLSDTVSKIIIDGYSAIQEKREDFHDIDAKKIPTILITDLSELEEFEKIGDENFDFYNFTKDNLKLDKINNLSPFSSFDKKLHKYVSFNLQKEVCENADLESITKLIHSIDKDESVKELMNLKILLIQLLNLVSRIAHPLSQNEVAVYKEMLSKAKTLFFENRFYLGGSLKAIEDSIMLLKTVIQRFAAMPSEKCTRLSELMKVNKYDYVICTTEDEALSLSLHLNSLQIVHKPNVISVADVNNSLLDSEPTKAILTGWAKTHNVNRLLTSFLFSELTVLFYQFESRYFNSLQNRNRKFSGNVKSTINKKGIRSEKEMETVNGFADLYKSESIVETNSNFDIAEFELKLENAQFSKYFAKGNLIESVKAKRVDFEDGFFTYSSESHKFLVINELIESAKGQKGNISKVKLDSLKPGDIIALINTDRDILVELVEKKTDPKDLESVVKWINLWKDLLKDYFKSTGCDFKKLVDDLRKNDCKKHETTIKAWLQDETRIGPDDNADLISIALLTNSNLLNDNIPTVRESISKMTGWRIKASDFIVDKIKTQIYEFTDSSIINKRISIEGLGSFMVLKVIEVSNVWGKIDIRFVNKLLQKEII